jgi:hypothetical protein
VDITANKLTGAVKVHGNEYVSDALTEALAGRSAKERRVVVRLDPEDLRLPVMVETLDGRLIGEAKLNGPVNYLDKQAARQRARDERRLERLAKEEATIHQRMDRAEYERLLDAAAEADREELGQAEQADSKVVRGAFKKERRDYDEDGDQMVANGDSLILAVAEQWRSKSILED